MKPKIVRIEPRWYIEAENYANATAKYTYKRLTGSTMEKFCKQYNGDCDICQISNCPHKQRIYVGRFGQSVVIHFSERHKFPFDPYPQKPDKDYETYDICYHIVNGEDLHGDVKTAWKQNHSRLLIPKDQYERKPKDIYIGVKLYLINETNILQFPKFKEEAEVWGWIKHDQLNSPKNFGEGLAYWAYLRNLQSMTMLETILRPPTHPGNWFK